MSKTNIPLYDNKKYNILQKIHKHQFYGNMKFNVALSQIADEIGTTYRSLSDWVYRKNDSKHEIPYSFLLKLSILFECSVEDLINYEIIKQKS